VFVGEEHEQELAVPPGDPFADLHQRPAGRTASAGRRVTSRQPSHEYPPIGQALRAALGSPVTVGRMSSSPRSRVWLVEFDGAPAIVKQIAGGPDAQDRYSREATALRLARRAHPPVVPAVLAADPGACLLVLEYLASQEPPAGEWMTDYATALARLHAATGPGDAGTLPAWSGPTPADVQEFLSLTAELRIPVPARLPGELDSLLDRLNQAARHALLHGDPCPDNTVHTSSGIRFIDLEQAALGNGYTELAYLWAGFPTCWCAKSVPEPLRSQAAAAYRATWRSITGASQDGQLADACAGWLLRGDALVERARRGRRGYLTQLPREDWAWGTATARERLLHRLSTVTAVAADQPELTSLAQVSRIMCGRIIHRWPDTRALPIARKNPVDDI
jgi:Ser/Thr protein kinase RdoA (MazF antagonist)